MSNRSLAKPKTNLEYWQWAWRKYQREHPGPFVAEHFVDWGLTNKVFDLPRVNPVKILIRKAKAAARAARIKDKQGRTVRELLPAKVPLEFDEHGNALLFEVRYDHIHSMSANHALLAFDQRDENIEKQRNSASRDLASFLDNNPNAKGREHQFTFNFQREEAEKQVVQKIEASSPKNKPR